MFSQFHSYKFEEKQQNSYSMKKLIFLILLLTSPFIFNVNAEDNNKPIKADRLILIEKEPAKAPRTLGDMFITCYYNNECIEVEFPADAECMEVTISNESVSVWSGIITCDAPTCDIPQLVGQYIITCTTDNGLVYQGLLSF